MTEGMSNPEQQPPSLSRETKLALNFARLPFNEVIAREKTLENLLQSQPLEGERKSKVESSLRVLERRKGKLVNEVRNSGKLYPIDQKIEALKLKGYSPEDLNRELDAVKTLDDESGIDKSDKHYGILKWYYRKELDKLLEDLKEQKEQTLGGQRSQSGPRPQPGGQPTAPQQVQPGGLSEAEKEVFGEGEAFSDRWVKARGIPTVVQYYRSRFGTEDEDDIDLSSVGSSSGTFKPSELFSTILETGGKDPRSGRMLSYLLEAYPGDSKTKEKFSSALVNGFLTMAALKDGLNSGRIDTLADAMGRGPSPQGIAQWLLFDPETRRSLALILRLQGYQVAGETGSLPSFSVKFSDHENIRADQIREYLNKVREAAGTDSGVVRLAYIIFRVLGHPHENSKFSQELVKKYMFTGEEDKEYPNRDLAPKDVASFIDNFKDPQEPIIDSKTGKPIIDPETKQPKNKALKQILAEKGVEGLAISLNRLPAEKIVREWRNYQLMLDFMDQISDLRAGRGGGSATTVSERQKAIVSQKEFNIALAKRILSPDSISRITDSSKIAFARGMNEAEKGGWREFFADLGFAPKQRKGK